MLIVYGLLMNGIKAVNMLMCITETLSHKYLIS